MTGHAQCVVCEGSGAVPSASGMTDVECLCITWGRPLTLVQTWAVNNGYGHVRYTLDAADQTLTRITGDVFEVIAENVTHAVDMRAGGYPIVFHGNGSSVQTGRAITFDETAR